MQSEQLFTHVVPPEQSFDDDDYAGSCRFKPKIHLFLHMAFMFNQEYFISAFGCTASGLMSLLMIDCPSFRMVTKYLPQTKANRMNFGLLY
jgi:hypothetical protein